MADLYPADYTSSSTVLGSTYTSGSDIDLRAKLHQILFGDATHAPQGHKVLIRSMQEYCTCVKDENRGQAYRRPDPKCSICHGEGYIYTDYVHTTWRSLINSGSGQLLGTLVEAKAGVTQVLGFNFFFEWDTDIKEQDHIIELKLGADGSLPATLDEENQLEHFRIIQLVKHRASNGRIEFIRGICERIEW